MLQLKTMGFYSSLCLVANAGVRAPQGSQMTEILTRVGVMKAGSKVPIGNLADDLAEYFLQRSAREQNPEFFSPDSISVLDKIQILDPEGSYAGKGWTISIHGYGYFFPLTQRDLVPFISSPKLIRLKAEVEAAFGGRYQRPLTGRAEVLDRTLIQPGDGWCWFGSQSF